MASLTNGKDDSRIIQFHDGNGKRRTMRLGVMPKRAAESIKSHVEQLVASQVFRVIYLTRLLIMR